MGRQAMVLWYMAMLQGLGGYVRKKSPARHRIRADRRSSADFEPVDSTGRGLDTLVTVRDPGRIDFTTQTRRPWR